ncbi:MAG: hypothetical protein HYR72_06305 [Deltaproteobacteria bacterium]|nr:hypothetical protein [Deltaproteobacteria bacterium]
MAVDAGMRFNVCVARWPGPIPYFEAYREVAESVRDGLQRLGHDARLSTHRIERDRVNILFGVQLLAADRLAKLPPDTIFYNLEQIPEGPLKPSYHAIGSRFALWDYNKRNGARLQQLGVARAIYVPIGYAPVLRRIAPAPRLDIDVLFYGLVDDHRGRILEELRRRGLRVEVAQGVYGATRDTFIARARVVLNLHLHKTRVFEIVRVSYVLANSKAVVSECGPDTEIEDDMREAVALAEYERVADLCEAVVRDDDRRREYERKGFEVISLRDQSRILDDALRKTFARHG